MNKDRSLDGEFLRMAGHLASEKRKKMDSFGKDMFLFREQASHNKVERLIPYVPDHMAPVLRCIAFRVKAK